MLQIKRSSVWPAFRRLLVGSVMLLLTSMASVWAQEPMQFDIPAQDAGSALRALALQAGFDVMFPQELVAGKQTKAIHGRYTADEALQRMLQGSGLHYTRSPAGAVIISDGPEDLQHPAPAKDPGDGQREPAGSGGAEPQALPIKGAMTSDQAIDGGTASNAASYDKSATQIQAVTVTARRRKESLQDVPISITALSGQDIKALGIRNTGDLQGVVPSLTNVGGNGVKKDFNPFIRGVGQRQTDITLDPAVATYIDGIYIGRPAGGLLSVAAVDSIEVLRGPQGTLFGRNATGGAINIITRKPKSFFEESVTVDAGNDRLFDGTIAVGGPLIRDVLYSRLTLNSSYSGGYFVNDADNSRWGGDNHQTGILQLRWLPADDLVFDLLGERTRIRETPRPQTCKLFETTDNNPGFFPTSVGIVDGNRDPSDNFNADCNRSAGLPPDHFESQLASGNDLAGRGRYWVDTSTVGLNGSWDLGEWGPLSGAQLKSITAWRRVAQLADEDLSGVNGPYLLRIQPRPTKANQYSQELQLSASALNKRVFATSGLYWYREQSPGEDIYRTAGVVAATPDSANAPPPGSGVVLVQGLEPTWQHTATDNKAGAWYGQLDFKIIDPLKLTAGLRYTLEKHWSYYGKAYAMESSMIQGALLRPTSPPTPGTSYPNGAPTADAPCIDSQSPSCSFFSTDSRLARMEDWRFNAMQGASLSTTNAGWTPMASLQYKLGAPELGALRLDEGMVYLTYSEGFHSGGVTQGAVSYPVPGTDPVDPATGIQSVYYETPITFKPERVRNYETGFKLTGFDRRVQSNIALYRMDYTNMQITNTATRGGLPIPYISNVGKAAIQGVEMEFQFKPLRDWRILLNGSLTDAKFKVWNDEVIPLGLDGYRNPEQPITYIDRSAEPMPNVPRWQSMLLTNYNLSLGQLGMLTPTIAARYSSPIYYGFDRDSYCYTYYAGCPAIATYGGQSTDPVTGKPVTAEPLPGNYKGLDSKPVIFLDARLTWASARDLIELSVWGKNLTNVRDNLIGGVPLVGTTGSSGLVYGDPRSYGLSLTVNYSRRP